MNNFLKKVWITLFIPMMVLPAHAEDIDIFLGTGDLPDGSRPNVLFILDNSNSMASPLSGSDGTRMETMKNAFTEVLNSISGVNIGFMRFNAPGGAIGYPVRNIDDVVTASLSSHPTIASSHDDGVEFIVDGSVELESEIIHLGSTETPGSIVTEKNVALTNQNNNSSETLSSGNNAGVGNPSYSLNGSTRLALRFENLGIPSTATIEEARIVFTATGRGTGDITYNIVGESIGNAPALTFDRREIRDRLALPTASSVNWAVSGDWVAGVSYRSENFADVLQEQVLHADWSEDNGVLYILDPVSGSSDRSVYLNQDSNPATQGEDGIGPRLFVRYSTPSPYGFALPNVAGLRFTNVAVPKGATINSARLNFYSAENTTQASRFYIRIQNAGDTTSFSAATGGVYEPMTRPWHTDVTSWNVTEEWRIDQPVSGPDIANLLQRVVTTNPDWCGNNSITLFIYPLDLISSRKVYSYEHGEAFRPTLEIDYTASDSDGCINPRYVAATLSTEDDAVEAKSGNVDNQLDRLYVTNNQPAAVRFRTLPIKQGAIIQEAYLEMTGYPYGEDGYASPSTESNTGGLSITIRGEPTDNSMGIPESRNNITDRFPLTSASVSWSPSAWSGFNTYRSPDISNVLNEIFARTGWEPGNALSLVLTTTSSNGRGAFSWDGGAGYAPRLVMKIASGGFDSSNNTVRSHINAAVNSLEARTWSPISDTLYEAARYYRGESVLYGQARGISDQRQGHTEKRFKRISHPDSWTDGASHTLPAGCLMTDSSNPACESEHISGFSDGSTSPASNTSKRYISPIESSCQSNHIIVLTDGHSDNLHTPTIDGVNSLPGISSCESDAGNVDERCARTLVEFLATNDQSGTVDGTNIVKTHTIAFNADNGTARSFMEDLARLGGGKYYLTDTGAELVTAISEVLRHIIITNTTFTTPGATVNQFNRLNHRNEVYFSLFRPDANPKWHGNLKRYQVAGDPPVLVDQNFEYAIDIETGFFKSTAKSFWSDSIDGDDIALGGAAYELKDDPALRNFYTYLPGVSGATSDLTAPVNQFHESNTEITSAMLSAVSDAERTSIMQWVRGVDVLDWDEDTDTTEQRKQMGDPLHSVPAVVTYGGSESDPDTTVFFGTNEGVLHAINAKDGSEHFAFMPRGTFGITKKLYQNTDTYTHPYGLDGSPVSWVYDANGDNKILGSDHVYLYFGMRRGGRNLYALDVTSRAKPKMLWEIEGGTGDFTHLGQTWSKPVVTKVKIGSTIKDVLVVGGGFDPAQDSSPNTRISHTMGNAIYIIDAVTGKRLWWASSAVSAGGLYDARMTYAIPAEVAVVDINHDSLADMFFVGDLGGQVWRFDLHQGESGSSLVTGGVLADLGGASGDKFRRFFSTPDVAYVARGGSPALAIAIGSGAVNEPLDRVTDDRFYVLFDKHVFDAPESIVKLTEADLTNRTDDLTASPVADAGWYIELENSGEKALSAPVVINNNVLFTTYEPKPAPPGSCSAVTGLGRFYAVNVLNANPISDGEFVRKEDRSQELKARNIPPSPKVLFPEEATKPLVLVGPEMVTDIDLSLSANWEKVYWYEK